jgi:insertion element IS1 protein InsB
MPYRNGWYDIRELRNKVLRHANHALVTLPRPRADAVRVRPKRAAELDELWSFVGTKATARWLWHALDHHSGRVLAYVVGTRKDTVFLKLKALLASFGITRYYTDKAGVYQRHLPPEQHTVGKLTMQKIERKHLPLRTCLKRLARRRSVFPAPV